MTHFLSCGQVLPPMIKSTSSEECSSPGLSIKRQLGIGGDFNGLSGQDITVVGRISRILDWMPAPRRDSIRGMLRARG
ncbi:MAG: hypothetical protein WCJ18_10640, partial [Planctomycetota bacterium]